ncbi:hypothetical protein AB5J62_10190 [Amycolatopsis sp. cg5]|uniref:hypothetical protein n=1 Tax=Amycolatopsis sp. cg5 TaxID=3238802 RepID=UPI0035239788
MSSVSGTTWRLVGSRFDAGSLGDGDSSDTNLDPLTSSPTRFPNATGVALGSGFAVSVSCALAMGAATKSEQAVTVASFVAKRVMSSLCPGGPKAQ